MQKNTSENKKFMLCWAIPHFKNEMKRNEENLIIIQCSPEEEQQQKKKQQYQRQNIENNKKIVMVLFLIKDTLINYDLVWHKRINGCLRLKSFN